MAPIIITLFSFELESLDPDVRPLRYSALFYSVPIVLGLEKESDRDPIVLFLRDLL